MPVTAACIRRRGSRIAVGSHLLELADSPNGIELAIGYAAVVVKARAARILANSKKDADAKLRLSGN